MFKKIFLLAGLIMLRLGLFAQSSLPEIISSYDSLDVSLGLIFIDKQELQLSLFDSDSVLVKQYPIACGKHLGQKKRSGDMKTPEGLFYVQEIKDASKWGHDFHDGKGFIKHAYGPWFIRLKTGFKGIGIHGTHDPESIGTRATEGCIRLENENLMELQPLVKIGMPVIISDDEVKAGRDGDRKSR